MKNENYANIKILLIITLLFVSLGNAVGVSKRDNEIEKLRREVKELSERVDDYENLISEIDEKIVIAEGEPSSETSELSKDINNGYIIIKESIKNFADKLK